MLETDPAPKRATRVIAKNGGGIAREAGINRRQAFYIILISVILAFVITIAAVRSCFSPDGDSYLKDIVCGKSLTLGSAPYKILSPQEMSAKSNVPESIEFSIATNRTAANLIDSNIETAAYPGNEEFDVVISLLAPHKIRKATIFWGPDGAAKDRINSWSLEAAPNDVSWKIIASGGFPTSQETEINTTFIASKIRLKAKSLQNWIGVNELQIVAKPLNN